MDTYPIMAGNHVRLFPAGLTFTLPASGGKAGREAMPGILSNKIANDLKGTADTTTDPKWVNPGVCDSVKVQHDTTAKEIFRPSPGKKVLYDSKDSNEKLTFTLSIVEAGPQTFEYVFGTDILDKSSSTYTPLAGGTKYAWVHIEQYDDSNTLFNTFNGYCKLSAKNVDFADDVVKYDIEAVMLYSSKNSGTLVASEA